MWYSEMYQHADAHLTTVITDSFVCIWFILSKQLCSMHSSRAIMQSVGAFLKWRHAVRSYQLYSIQWDQLIMLTVVLTTWWWLKHILTLYTHDSPWVYCGWWCPWSCVRKISMIPGSHSHVLHERFADKLYVILLRF